FAPSTYHMLNVINGTSALLSLLFLVLVMRSLFSRLDRRAVILFVTYTLVLYAVGFTPALGQALAPFFPILLLPYMIEVARQAVLAVRKKARGAWIISTGALIYLICAVLLEQVCYALGITMPLWLRMFIQYSAYLPMPVSIVIYLAARS